jgi:hypothetical protein
MQQRGFDMEDVAVIISEGIERRAPGNASIHMIPNQEIDARISLIKTTGINQQRLRRLMRMRNKAVVLSSDGTIITVEHRTKRLGPIS